jgi:hypothetical protein
VCGPGRWRRRLARPSAGGHSHQPHEATAGALDTAALGQHWALPLQIADVRHNLNTRQKHTPRSMAAARYTIAALAVGKRQPS